MEGINQVAIVEDDELTRVALRERINACEGLTVVSEYANCASARAGLSALTPDVLLVDLGLPDGSGIDIISAESTRHPQLPIMVISVFGDEGHVVKAIQSGARGYLLKDSSSGEIDVAIKQLLEGGSPITPAIARHLIKRFQSNSTLKSEDDHSALLSAREREVLVLASKGFSYVETAEMLNLSINTIASYTKRVYAKLAVSSRSQAIYEATRLGEMSAASIGHAFQRRIDD